VLIVPISIARFASYAGARVPHGFTFLADLIFALGGLSFLLLTDAHALHATPTPDLICPISPSVL